jgi:hypothetical protein
VVRVKAFWAPATHWLQRCIQTHHSWESDGSNRGHHRDPSTQWTDWERNGTIVQRRQHWWSYSHPQNMSAANHDDPEGIRDRRRTIRCHYVGSLKARRVFVIHDARFASVNTPDASLPLRGNRNHERLVQVKVWSGAQTALDTETTKLGWATVNNESWLLILHTSSLK